MNLLFNLKIFVGSFLIVWLTYLHLGSPDINPFDIQLQTAKNSPLSVKERKLQKLRIFLSELPPNKVIGFVTDSTDPIEIATQQVELRYFLSPHIFQKGELFPWILGHIKGDIKSFLADKKIKIAKKFGDNIYLLRNEEVAQ